MHIIFDLMGTVFGLVDMSLRPGIKETVTALRESGITVDFWTGGNAEDFSKVLESRGIKGNVYSKWKPLPFAPDLYVDDEDLDHLGGKVFKVKEHVSYEMPGENILVAELLYFNDRKNFFWD